MLPWIVLDVNDVAGGVGEGLVFAIVLLLVTAPGVAVGADEVVAVAGVGVVEHIGCFLYRPDMTHPYPNPRRQLHHLHPPPLHRLRL